VEGDVEVLDAEQWLRRHRGIGLVLDVGHAVTASDSDEDEAGDADDESVDEDESVDVEDAASDPDAEPLPRAVPVSGYQQA
jgi:hypothetical protein